MKLQKPTWLQRRIERYQERFEAISQRPDRKSWFRICLEMNSRKVRKDLKKSGYMTLQLYRKDSAALQDYISQTTWRAFLDRTRDPKITNLLNDKVAFQTQMEAAGFALPKFFGVYRDQTFEIQDGNVTAHYEAHQANAALKHLWSISDRHLFVKTISGSGGIGAFRLTREMTPEALIETLGENDYLFQEAITQHPDVAAFHPNSLNTIRLTTVTDDEGKAFIFGGLFRIGVGGSEVDNSHAGGYCNIHALETGELEDACYLFYQDCKMEYHHCDSGLPFAGFSLPFYPQARALVLEAAERMPPNHVIGWDIALTPEGPIMIEGNGVPANMLDQLMRGPYMKRPHLKEMIYRLTDGKGL
jgi:hypothetical protein